MYSHYESNPSQPKPNVAELAAMLLRLEMQQDGDGVPTPEERVQFQTTTTS